MAPAKPTIHEVDFCSQMASAANALILQNPGIYPFREARVEGFGTGAGPAQAQGPSFLRSRGKLVLCGEVKLPGTPEGRSAFADKLMQDAVAKADDAGVSVLLHLERQRVRAVGSEPLGPARCIERRVRVWRLGRTLAGPEDVAREDNLSFIKTHFLPDLLRDLADIISGRRRDWLPPDDIFIRSLESHLDWPVQLAGAYILDRPTRTSL